MGWWQVERRLKCLLGSFVVVALACSSSTEASVDEPLGSSSVDTTVEVVSPASTVVAGATTTSQSEVTSTTSLAPQPDLSMATLETLAMATTARSVGAGVLLADINRRAALSGIDRPGPDADDRDIERFFLTIDGASEVTMGGWFFSRDVIETRATWLDHVGFDFATADGIGLFWRQALVFSGPVDPEHVRQVMSATSPPPDIENSGEWFMARWAEPPLFDLGVEGDQGNARVVGAVVTRTWVGVAGSEFMLEELRRAAAGEADVVGADVDDLLVGAGPETFMLRFSAPRVFESVDDLRRARLRPSITPEALDAWDRAVESFLLPYAFSAGVIDIVEPDRAVETLWLFHRTEATAIANAQRVEALNEFGEPFGGPWAVERRGHRLRLTGHTNPMNQASIFSYVVAAPA